MKISRTLIILEFVNHTVKNIQNEFYRLNSQGIYNTLLCITDFTYYCNPGSAKDHIKLINATKVELLFIRDLVIKILKETGYICELNTIFIDEQTIRLELYESKI